MVGYIGSEEMRALEKRAIESGAVTGLQLMERAGAAVLQAVLEEWPELNAAGQAVVLCGPGNNGGDGFVIARLLKEAGWAVKVFFYGIAERLPPDARQNFDRWNAVEGASTIALSFPEVKPEDVAVFDREVSAGSGTELIVDALFGIGLTRPITGLATIIECVERHCNRRPGDVMLRRVSVDLPSGLSGASSNEHQLVFPTQLTVTFHAKKTAHRHSAARCGRIIVKDIGL